MKKNKYYALLLLNIFLSLRIVAQDALAGILLVTSDDHKLTSMGICYPALIKEFYKTCQHRPVWMSVNGALHRITLFKLFHVYG